MVIVAGPRGAGKSCLIASAIVHARRLAALDVALARHAPVLSRNDVQEAGAKRHRRTSSHSTGDGFDLWSAQESVRFHGADQLDSLAMSLWRRWLVQPDPGASEVASSPFSVSLFPADLLGLLPDKAGSQDVVLVEVSSDLFDRFDRGSEAVWLTASHRLRQFMRSSETLVICLPCDGDWSAEAIACARRMMKVWRELRGLDAKIALTKSDVPLTELALTHRRCIDPHQAASADLVSQIVAAEPAKAAFRNSLLPSMDAAFQPCSSYGMLRASGTANLDLIGDDMLKPREKQGRFPPLWPTAAMSLSDIVPSIPHGLRHWVPLGAVELILGAVPPLAPL